MKFDVIIADPPWKYNQQGRGAASKHYKGMTTRELVSVGTLVKKVRVPHTLLFMWTCWPQLPETFPIMTAWDMTYLTCGFIWLKTLKNDPTRFRMSGGSYTRANTEPCFIGKGKSKVSLKRTNKGVRQILPPQVPERMFEEPDEIYAPISRHSEKPDQFYEAIDALYPGYSKLELFARKQRPGWTCVGNEVCDGEDIRESLQRLISLK